VKRIYAGIDLGGTGSRFITYGSAGVLSQITVPTADISSGSRDARLARLSETVSRLVPPGARLMGLGIGASGPVDRARGVINNPETLPGFSGIRLIAGLERQLGVPVTIDNDAMVAAIAEQRIGAGRKASRLLTITLGTGIGVALVVDGQPFRGLHGAHPEAGHIPIVSDAKRCYCGIQGCWEQLASRFALQGMLLPFMPVAIPESRILDHAARNARRSAICKAFFDYGALLGRGLSTLLALYMPDLTVLGGSASKHYSLFATGLHSSLSQAGKLQVKARIVVTTLGDSAGAIGAAILAKER